MFEVVKHKALFVFFKNRLQGPFLVLRLGRGFITIFNSSFTYQRGEDVIAQVFYPFYHFYKPFPRGGHVIPSEN